LTKEQILFYLSKKYTYKQISEETDISVGSVFNLCKYYGINNKRVNDLDENIFDDINFWRVLGYWVAEGSLTYSCLKENTNIIRFSFGDHESALIEDTIEFFEKRGIHCTLYFTDRSSGVVQLTSMQLAHSQLVV